MVQAQLAQADCNKYSRRLIESRREAASPTALYLHPHWAVRRVLKNRDSAAKLADLISGSVTELEPCLSLVPAFVVGAG